ncbi:hypothetical protein ACE6H2_002852 [Prunus campanulata]
MLVFGFLPIPSTQSNMGLKKLGGGRNLGGGKKYGGRGKKSGERENLGGVFKKKKPGIRG